MKTVLLVPGFRESLKTHDYERVLKAIESKGFKAKFVPISWQRSTINDWAQDLKAEFQQYDPKDTILAGFSYGSMIALVNAARRQPAELWLFSLSPYFSDDLPKLKKSWKANIGHRRVSTFGELDFSKLAGQINCPTIIMLGEVEADKYPLMRERADSAKRLIKGSCFVIAEGADHDITSPEYIEAIKETIG